MKKAISTRWFYALLLTFFIAAPAANAKGSVESAQIVAQADNAPETPSKEEATEQKKDPQKSRAVVAQTKEGKYALGAVVVAVVALFILIFIKSSKLE